MKVNRQTSPNPIVRGLVALSLTWILALGGAAVPLAANAEASVPATQPAPSALTTEPISALETSAGLESSRLATIAPLPAPVKPPAPPAKKKPTIRQLIAQAGRKAGLSTNEISALMWVCKRESGFHPSSHSRSGYHGLFQLSKGMAHGHPWKNVAWNTKRAIKYMRGRYGGVLQAKRFWSAHHWY